MNSAPLSEFAAVRYYGGPVRFTCQFLMDAMKYGEAVALPLPASDCQQPAEGLVGYVNLRSFIHFAGTAEMMAITAIKAIPAVAITPTRTRPGNTEALQRVVAKASEWIRETPDVADAVPGAAELPALM